MKGKPDYFEKWKKFLHYYLHVEFSSWCSDRHGSRFPSFEVLSLKFSIFLKMEVLKISTTLSCLIHTCILHCAFKSIGLEVYISIYVYSISLPAIKMQLQ